MRILLVHNTGAGDEAHESETIADLIREHGHTVTLAGTDDWKSAVDASIELVAAAGGDGTVEDVARYLACGTIPIAVLPLGTANNVARALGVADTPIADLVSGWATAERRGFDTGRAIGAGVADRFIESVGAGLLADAIAEITEGRAGYVDRLNDAGDRMDAAMDVLRHTLRRQRPVRVDLVLDERRISGEYLLIEVMTFGSAGPNLNLVPDADPADGLFDIVLAEERDRERLLDELPRYRLGHRADPPLTVHRARRVELAFVESRAADPAAGGPAIVHIDDRLLTEEARLVLTVEPGAVTFLV